jgi:parallel beta-helix repeat protein
VFEAGIAVYESDDVQILNVKFIDNKVSLYLEDSQDLTIRYGIFDVKEYGIWTIGSSSGLHVIDSEFRNGTYSSIYQSASEENGAAQIIANTFDNCATGWDGRSSNNIFRDNILEDNQYGIMLGGTESYNNMVSDNTFDDNHIGIFIYNSAHDNNLFNNIFDDSEVYDISLSDSDDTVSYNNTFSDINVNEESNMWIKVYIDLTVYDNSSNAFQNADVRVKEDNLVLYSTSYFGGSDAKTNSTGQFPTFLVATLQYNGTYTDEVIRVEEDNVIIKNLTVVSSYDGAGNQGDHPKHRLQFRPDLPGYLHHHKRIRPSDS